MRVKQIALLAVSAAALSGISTVNATQLSNSFGLPTPGYVQTFESPAMAINTVINTTFAGISSSTLFYDGNTGGGNCAFFEESGNCVSNFTSTPAAGVITVNPTFSIFFNVPQTSAAFAMVTGGADNDTFTALLNGAIVSQFTALTAPNYNPASSGPGNYFGFANIGLFNQIMVQTTGSNLAVIDNVQFAPEPGTIALFGLGIAGLAAFTRRRRSV